MEKTSLNVDRLLSALSVILSERTGAAVTVRRMKDELPSVKEIGCPVIGQ